LGFLLKKPSFKNLKGLNLNKPKKPTLSYPKVIKEGGLVARGDGMAEWMAWEEG